MLVVGLAAAAGAAAAGAAAGGALGLGGQALAFRYLKRVYKTRYQWTAQDLEKAGLNRILALTKGVGAATATPAGAGPSVPGVQALLAAAQLKAIQANTAKTVAETRMLDARGPTAEAKETLMKWLFDQVRSVVGDPGQYSAKQLLGLEGRRRLESKGPGDRPKVGVRRPVVRVHKWDKGEK